MKTKMLFSAAMMTALFAACTNEDFVSNSQQFDESNEGRIVVENVALNFVKGGDADTRLSFDPSDGHWAWEGNETIGALLMDDVWGTGNGYLPYENPKEWAELTWLEKYQLTNEIHTDFPFTYNAEEEKWESPAKMLEGNYFFAYPHNGYMGRRQAVHYLNNQVQEGSSEESMIESFSKNQFWVGYAQIKEAQAADENQDNIKDVYMTHVLAPIRLDISTIGTGTYHINKIQIKGTGLTSAVYLDPTDANYDGSIEGKTGDYNLKSPNAWVDANNKYFNYANLLGLDTDLYDHTTTDPEQEDYVWNIDDADNYVKGDALRAIVKPLNVTGETTYSELVINNAKELKANGEHVYATIYVTPIGKVTGNLTMSIFTDEGVVKDVDLTEVNEEVGGSAQDNTAITNKAIENLTPTTSNLITVQIDDNSFHETDELDINNADDLKQFITWNSKQNRTYTATLKNDVTLSAELQKMIIDARAANADNKLVVEATSDEVLTLAPGYAEIFNYIDVEKVDVELEGIVNINSDKIVALPGTGKKITIAYDEVENKGGGVYMQKYDLDDVLVIENYAAFQMEAGYVAKNIQITNKKTGIIAVNGDLTFARGSVNEPEGNINVGATGILRAAGNLTNQGTIRNLGGKMYNLVNDDKESALIITSGAEGAVNHFNSNGTNATIELSTLKDKITGTTTPGHVKFEAVSGYVDASKVLEAKVTDLVLTGATLRVDGTQLEAANTLKSIEGTNATIEGGAYDANDAWVVIDKDKGIDNYCGLAMATVGGEITLSGNTTLNNFYMPNVDGAEAITIKSGTVTVKNRMYFTSQDMTEKYGITLGSKEGFEKFGVNIYITAGAKFGCGNMEEAVGSGDSKIENNGQCKIENNSDWSAANGNVSGNAVEGWN